MKKILAIASLTAIFTLALTACGPVQNQDRSGGEGSSPDFVYDTELVELYRNADNIPNISYFCAGDYGWASTLSNDSTSAPSLVRFPEYDSRCADLPDQETAPQEQLESPEEQ